MRLARHTSIRAPQMRRTQRTATERDWSITFAAAATATRPRLSVRGMANDTGYARLPASAAPQDMSGQHGPLLAAANLHCRLGPVVPSYPPAPVVRPAVAGEGESLRSVRHMLCGLGACGGGRDDAPPLHVHVCRHRARLKRMRGRKIPGYLDDIRVQTPNREGAACPRPGAFRDADRPRQPGSPLRRTKPGSRHPGVVVASWHSDGTSKRWWGGVVLRYHRGTRAGLGTRTWPWSPAPLGDIATSRQLTGAG